MQSMHDFLFEEDVVFVCLSFNLYHATVAVEATSTAGLVGSSHLHFQHLHMTLDKLLDSNFVLKFFSMGGVYWA